jgi:hypothetical protein
MRLLPGWASDCRVYSETFTLVAGTCFGVEIRTIVSPISRSMKSDTKLPLLVLVYHT